MLNALLMMGLMCVNANARWLTPLTPLTPLTQFSQLPQLT